MRRGTYSVVVRDEATGGLGVAVHSHWFSVGSIVSWAEAGVGAVATQSVAEPAYGPGELRRLRDGEHPEPALRAMLAADEQARYRQVAVVDALGRVAVHTGQGCIEHAGHVAGEGFSCQANMMARPGVPEAMAEALSGDPSPLPERLLAALDAAEAAGGDVRGRQSAALLVVPPVGEAWERDVDLRVEDSADPLGELRRLLSLHRAYEEATRGDDLTAEGRFEEAGAAYLAAAALAPESDELLFWAGLGAAQGGDVDGGVAKVREAADRHAGWLDLLDRLQDDIAPSAAAVRRALGR
jgi:uncharacterized Ntn-hydrolase superfamily protein